MNKKPDGWHCAEKWIFFAPSGKFYIHAKNFHFQVPHNKDFLKLMKIGNNYKTLNLERDGSSFFKCCFFSPRVVILEKESAQNRMPIHFQIQIFMVRERVIFKIFYLIFAKY